MGKEAEFLKAIKKNNMEKILKLLTNSKDPPRGSYTRVNIDVNYPEHGTGYTPLILAVLQGDIKLVELLINHDADVNATDDKRNTALHYAAFNERCDIADILLKQNADSGQSNSDGNTPLHIICQGQSAQKVLLVFKLIQNADRIMIKNKKGYTPLDVAVMYNRKDAVAAMLENNPSGHDMSLALVEACIRGYTDIAELLLNYGASPNFINLLKGTAPLHEALRHYRYDTVRVLIHFGADVQLRNANGETPRSIIDKFPKSLGDKFRQLIVESCNLRKRPSYISDDGTKLAKEPNKDYPLIPMEPWWTQNSQDFCNSSTAKHPNTNLLDGNPRTFWVMPTVTHAWTVFDLRDEYLITGLQIIGWNSPQMIRTIELQKGTKLSGPWISVGTFKCESKGSIHAMDVGVPQDFGGLNDRSRYWRLLIYDNHGGQCMCFQGVGLFGADWRVIDTMRVAKLEAYTDAIVQKEGLNMYSRFLQLTRSQLLDIIKEEKDVDVLLKLLRSRKLGVFAMKNLTWIKTPVASWTCNKPLPDFMVASNPCVTEPIQLYASGEPMKDAIVHLESQGESKQSLATFTNVRFQKGGVYSLEVRSIQFPDIKVTCPHDIVIKDEAKDSSEIAAAFDDITSMLMESMASLDKGT